MIWFDYVLLFILILNLYKGLREGLLRQVAALISFFTAFYVALCLCCTTSAFFQNSLKLHKLIPALSRDASISPWPANVLMNILAFLLLFFIFYSLQKHFGRRLKILNRVPFIGPVNAFLGAIAGGIKGLVIIFLITALLSLIKTDFWMNTLESSALVALSSYYLPLFYGLIVDHAVKRLGTLI